MGISNFVTFLENTSDYRRAHRESGTGMITLISDGVPVGTTTAGGDGNWTIVVPADAITGAVSSRAADASGTVTQESEPIQLGPRPPSLSISGEVGVDPGSGESILPLAPGPFTWTGRAEPGTRIEMLIDGLRVGTADVDESGAWALPVNMPAGDYSLQLNSLDLSGNLLAATPLVRVVVGDGAPTTEPGPTAVTGTLDSVLASRPEEFSTLLSVSANRATGSPATRSRSVSVHAFWIT